MGSQSINDMREFLEEDRALRWHLSSNHYPPIHSIFLDTARQAIERGREAVLFDDQLIFDEIIKMPNGIEKSVADIIVGMHLESFIDGDD